MVLRQRVTERFCEVNGVHPMTAADDAYVSGQFVVLEELCAAAEREPDDVRRLMLDRRLPLPGYLRSDGAEMVPAGQRGEPNPVSRTHGTSVAKLGKSTRPS